MKKVIPRESGFFLSLCLNLAFQFEWIIIGSLLLVVHFIFGLSIWFAVVVYGLWLLQALLVTITLTMANRCGNQEPVKEKPNVNPYSVGAKIKAESEQEEQKN